MHCNKTVALKQKESQNVFRFIKMSPSVSMLVYGKKKLHLTDGSHPLLTLCGLKG